MKKIFFSLMLGVFCLLISHNAQAAYTPMSGDVVKLSNSPAMYYIDDYNTRHLFPNAVTYWSWHNGTWKDQNIKVISQDDFDSLSNGNNVTARPGTGLIQFDNSSKVFALMPGAILCEARALYGDNWKSRVIPIQSSFENDYYKNSACTIISSSKYPDGSIIQYVGSKEIWYIEGGKKRLFSGTSFAANEFKDSHIIKNAPTSIAYTTGAKITGIEPGFGVGSVVNASTNPIAGNYDLSISSIVLPTTKIYSGSVVDIQVVVKNLGANLTSEKGLRSTIFSGTNWTTNSITMPGLPSVSNPLLTNQTFTITYRGKFTSAGSKTLKATTDEGLEIKEINENNNSLSKSVTVY